ncbi:MAG: DUF5681 domain-containing protein [Alphaproteobacteria bacterium]
MSDNDDDNDKKGYEVGYGKPPKGTRFGAENGNPSNKKGRPKGRNLIEYDRMSEEALWECVLQTAQAPVKTRQDGNDMIIPYFLALNKKMAQDAINGDHHARRDLLRLIEKAVRGTDKMKLDFHAVEAAHEERKLKAMSNPGSLQHFNVMYAEFMTRKHLRNIIGGDEFNYTNEEPTTDEDWGVFIKHHDYLKKHPNEVVPWPLEYPSKTRRT